MAFIKKMKRKLNGVEKWTVGAVTAGKPVTTEELCKYIADSTTASASDVMAVLLSLPKVMELYLKNGRSVKLEDIGTFRYTVTAGLVDNEVDATEALIRDVKVRFTPERTATAVGKQRIVHRALIADNLTWEIYDKPSKKKPTTGSDTPDTPGGDNPGGDNGGGNDNPGGGDNGGDLGE
ncbi:MAG: DNA-binding protein [Bacteroidales bacterium]|nr:DNA-binding protein [Bacteroidales bacterium]